VTSTSHAHPYLCKEEGPCGKSMIGTGETSRSFSGVAGGLRDFGRFGRARTEAPKRPASPW
jgi:hypothetical protein